MLQTLKNAWKTKDIRSKIIFTLFILLLYRIGTVIPVPFVDANNFANSASFQGTIMNYMDILSGGSLSASTLFALGVSPYINASIILQLLAVVFPKLGDIAKNDKKKMGFITRIVTVVLAIVTGIGYYFMLLNAKDSSGNAIRVLTNAATKGEGPVYWLYGIVIVACYVAGASVVMWLAERINEHGIGNGISLILFANIVSSAPTFMVSLVQLIAGTFDYSNPGPYIAVSIIFAVVLLAIIIGMMVFVIWVTGSERRIPVQYAKRVVGRKMYGGQSSNLPIKLNMTGVMPVIFASSIVTLVPTILQLCGVTGKGDTGWDTFARIMGTDGAIFPIAEFILIIAFAYFYTQISFNPTEVANNLKKQGGAVPGIRQGRPTAEYIKKILNKITLAGALFLSIVAVIPVIAGPHIISPILQWIYEGGSSYMVQNAEAYANSLSSVFTFGGTSLLIVVGVAIETYRELEAQLTMRSYKGFL